MQVLSERLGPPGYSEESKVKGGGNNVPYIRRGNALGGRGQRQGAERRSLGTLGLATTALFTTLN
jgi:hypothetical protein